MKQGWNPGQVVFAGVGNQAEDEEAVEDVDVVHGEHYVVGSSRS